MSQAVPSLRGLGVLCDVFPSTGVLGYLNAVAARLSADRCAQRGGPSYQKSAYINFLLTISSACCDANQRTRARAQLGTELRRALERGEFALAYQPKFDLRSGKPCAVCDLPINPRPAGRNPP